MTETMTDARKQELLEKVGGAVGLLIDAGAIECDRSNETSWIQEGRIDKTRGPRVRPLQSLLVCSGERRSPRSTGVLFRGGDEKVYIATSAHCITVDKKWCDQVRLFVGLSSVTGRFCSRQVIKLGGIEHYEEMPDRDLVILRGVASGAAPALSLPPENLGIAVGDQVFVVGHAGGLDVDVYSGRVSSRLPPDPSRLLRGFHVVVEGPRPCLSGSPVFVWPSGSDPVLCGVLQGQKEVQIHEQLANQLFAKIHGFAKGDEMRARRWLRLIDRSLLHAELVARYGDAIAIPTAAIRRRLRTLMADGDGTLMSVGEELSTEATMLSYLLEPLEGELTSSQIEEVASVVMVQDHCVGSPNDNIYNIVFLGGNLSVFFKQD